MSRKPKKPTTQAFSAPQWSLCFPSLPVEILGLICEYLGGNHLLALCSTSKGIKQKLLSNHGASSFSYFRLPDSRSTLRRFFSKIGLMQKMKGLRTLEFAFHFPHQSNSKKEASQRASDYCSWPQSITSLSIICNSLEIFKRDEWDPSKYDLKNMMPHLQILKLRHFCKPNYHHHEADMELSFNYPSSLTHLEYTSSHIITVDHNDFLRGLPRNLNRLSLQGNIALSFGLLPSSSLTQLEIDLQSIPSNRGLTPELKEFKQLEYLKIAARDSDFSRGHFDSLNLRGIHNLPPSLRTLILHHIQNTLDFCSMGLDQLQNLTYLSIPNGKCIAVPKSVTSLNCLQLQISGSDLPSSLTKLSYGDSEWQSVHIQPIQSLVKQLHWLETGTGFQRAKLVGHLSPSLHHLKLIIDPMLPAEDLMKYISDIPRSVKTLIIYCNTYKPLVLPYDWVLEQWSSYYQDQISSATDIKHPHISSWRALSIPRWTVQVDRHLAKTVVCEFMELHGINDFCPNDEQWISKVIPILLPGLRLEYNPEFDFDTDLHWASILPNTLTTLRINDGSTWNDSSVSLLPKSLMNLKIGDCISFSDHTLSLLPPNIRIASFPHSVDFSIKLYSIKPLSLQHLEIGGFNITSEIGAYLDPNIPVLNFDIICETMALVIESKSKSNILNLSFYDSRKPNFVDMIDDELGKHIAKLESLTEIKLDGEYLTDSIMRSLPKNLTKLTLQKNILISDIGIFDLSKSSCSKKLKALILPANVRISIRSPDLLPPHLQSYFLRHNSWSIADSSSEGRENPRANPITFAAEQK